MLQKLKLVKVRNIVDMSGFLLDPSTKGYILERMGGALVFFGSL